MNLKVGALYASKNNGIIFKTERFEGQPQFGRNKGKFWGAVVGINSPFALETGLRVGSKDYFYESGRYSSDGEREWDLVREIVP